MFRGFLVAGYLVESYLPSFLFWVWHELFVIFGFLLFLPIPKLLILHIQLCYFFRSLDELIYMLLILLSSILFLFF